MIGFMKQYKIGIIVLAVIVLSTGTWAIYHNSSANASQPKAAPPAVPVFVLTTQEKPVRTWTEYSGRLQAVDYAEIRPEVSGRINEIRFQDGQTVKEGDILFVIDPRTYQAAVEKAQADLTSAKTNAEFSKTEFDRASDLIKNQAIPQRVYDERSNANQMAQSAVQAAQSGLDQAQIALDHAYVKAPISGRVSRAEITVGNLVNAGPGAPVLTSIVSNNGIYADFEVDEQTYLQSIRKSPQDQEEEQQIPVQLTIQGDRNIYKGTIHSFDNHINPSSGTIRARAKFGNEDGSLVPGMFVSIKLGSAFVINAILVPERAIGSDQNKKFVYVVDKDNKVLYREVELGKEVEGQRIVIAGLKQGERVIVDGLQHVRPDTIVDAKDIASKADNPPVESKK